MCFYSGVDIVHFELNAIQLKSCGTVYANQYKSHGNSIDTLYK